MPYRLAGSIGTALALLGSCLHYSLRDPRPANTGNVIAYLETVSSLWPLVFGASVLALAVALVTRRALHTAHMIAAGVLAAYAFALFYTAAFTGSGWVTACFATGLTVHTIALAASYMDER